MGTERVRLTIRRIRFATRLAVLLLALFVLVQVPTFMAFSYATRESALAQAKMQLDAGVRVFEELMRSRSAQLFDAVRITTSDFGFKQAVATGDGPTIHTVLYNQGHRIKADLTVLVNMDDSIMASLDASGAPVPAAPWSELIGRSRGQQGSIVAMIGGRPYQLVIVPVMAPEQIGWIGMGFALDAALAQNLKQVTQIEVSLVARDDDRLAWSASTLPGMTGGELAQIAAGLSASAPVASLAEDASAAPLVAVGQQMYFTRVQRLQGADATLGAVLQYPRARALASYDSLRRQLMIIAALALIASIGGALWLSRLVTRPVSLLAAAARRIGGGDYAAQVQTRYDDELGELAQAFNGMQQGIAQREQQIAHQAFHDHLTALPNRASLTEQLPGALARATAAQHTLAVMMLDVDRFKEINDTMGHAIGDQVLMEIARRLRTRLRSGDLLARFGGDEFVLLLEGVDADALAARAEQILATVAAPILADAMELFVDASAGMALFPEHGNSADELLRRADIAMYDAKEARSRLKIYQSGRDARHLYRLSLVNDLRRAIGNRELVLYYQPKISLDGSAAMQVEALLRWNHPQHGLVPPDEFIPLAEHSGIIRPLTDWVIHEVIRQCAAWSAAGMPIGVAINLSAMDLGSGDLPVLLQQHLDHYRIDPALLVLEVTETAVMRDAVYSLEVLKRLKACGVRLAIDDFGTGYSSLSHLKRLPVDELKIDKSFVMRMDEDEDDAVIVRSTIELAHNMGLKVVAEGVENEASLAMLRQFRCNSAQGFLISRPIPVHELNTWLAARQALEKAQRTSGAAPV